MSYDDGGMGNWKPTCSKCFRPEGFVCRCKEIELEQENARLKEKLKALADAAVECLKKRDSYSACFEGIDTNNPEYTRLRLSVAAGKFGGKA